MLNSKGNYNLFVGDKAYKTNFYLDFLSSKTEFKFREDAYARNKFSLVGFMVISLVVLVSIYMSSICFQFHAKCKHDELTFFTMISLVMGIVFVRFNFNPYVIRGILMINSLFYNIYFFDQYQYHTAVLITISQIFVTSNSILSFINIVIRYFFLEDSSFSQYCLNIFPHRIHLSLQHYYSYFK